MGDWTVLLCRKCGATSVEAGEWWSRARCRGGHDPVELVALTLDERRALVVRIDGSQTIERVPNYQALLAEARCSLSCDSESQDRSS